VTVEGRIDTAIALANTYLYIHIYTVPGNIHMYVYMPGHVYIHMTRQWNIDTTVIGPLNKAVALANVHRDIYIYTVPGNIHIYVYMPGNIDMYIYQVMYLYT